MAVRSGIVLRSILILVYLFILSSGEATKQEDRATKEYSRIRQLSADQYGSQYGVTHDPSGRRPQEKHQPRNTMAVRPLFAWNEMAVLSSDKLPSTGSDTAVGPTPTKKATHHRSKFNLKTKKQREMTMTVLKKSNAISSSSSSKTPLKSVRLLKKSLDGEDEGEEDEGDEEGEDEEGDEERGDEEEDEEEEEDDEEGGDEEGDESDDNQDSEDRQEEDNQRITTSTTTTTTTSTSTTPAPAPAQMAGPSESSTSDGSQDFIDRLAQSSGDHVDKDDPEDQAKLTGPSGPSFSTGIGSSSNAVRREEDDNENVTADPDEREDNVDQRSNQIEQGRQPDTDRNRTAGSVGNIRSDSNVNHEPFLTTTLSSSSIETKIDDDKEEGDDGEETDVQDRSENDSIRLLASGRSTSTGSENGSKVGHAGRKEPTRVSQSNLIGEQVLLAPSLPAVDSISTGIDDDDAEEEGDRDEANEIRAQVQSENESSSGTVSVSSEDDETNDIEVRPTGNRAKASDTLVESVRSDEDDSDGTNDPQFNHPSRSNQNTIVNQPLPTTDILNNSGQDETNDIRPSLSSSKTIEETLPPPTSVDQDTEDDDDNVDNEIKTFVHPDHRLLHGQIELNPAVLDVSCGPSTTLPVIPNAVVTKYGRTRWPSPPFNLLAEVIFECQGDGQTAYQLDPALPDRLFCSNQEWIGQHPRCVAINRQQQPHFALTGTSHEEGEKDRPTLTTRPNAVNSTLTGVVTSAAGVRTNERGCSSEDRGGCEHVCSQSAEPDSIRCLCYRGFRLDADGKSCIDVDECATANGGCDGQCTNRPGSFLCSCPVGFRLASNGKKCIDVNECSLRNGHGPCQGVCHNTHGSYHCSCEDMTGTQLAVDGHSCEDIDECRTDNGGCSHSCLNTLGTAFCACPEGYMLADDWKTCDDIDECDYDPDDDQDRLCPGMCRNTIGSYVCVDPDEEPLTCQPGYEPKEEIGLCRDIDECASSSNGGCSHTCLNTEGSYQCQCPTGLFLETDNQTCKDIDECASENGGCSHSCVNVPSSYQCTCPEGYALDSDWKTCQDVDECAESNLATCGAVGSCLNLLGSYRCICPAGYEETGNGCVDTDECLIDPCGSGECYNTEGSYSCVCHVGFQFDNQTCQDVNECSDGNPCFDGLCENTVGSFTCSCQPGYYLENNTCFDVDECVNSPCIDGSCVNQPGSYLCLCEPGFTLERNVCIDFDECLISPCLNGTCVNQIGTFRCDCPDGYTSQNNSCFDVDECQSSPCVNGQCVNTEGSYWCRCLDGFKALGNICLDIDECEAAPCVNGECINTQGSYQCECLPGFYLEDDSCFDVDECQADPCVNGTCANLLGSYQCNCPAGHVLVDSRICLDINECATKNGDCDQTCTNTAGSYYCSCDHGFYLNPEDKRQCLDVDECAIQNGGCSQVCLNRPGNYSCECRTGYILSTDKVSCLEVVSAVTHYCPPIEPPPGGYLHCSSRPSADGYKPGTTCTLRCRKGYAFRRHKPQLTWQGNQVLDNPITIEEKTAILLPASRTSSGLAMLQGWKATQIRPTNQDWQLANRNSSEEAQKKLKEKNGKKMENDKRQLNFSGRLSSVQQGPLRRNRNRHQSEARVKRQQQQQGRRALLDQPFRRCGDDGKWKGKLGFCQALTCPPLTKPANGSVSPLSCSTGDAAPNQHCYFTCDPGFRVTGNPVRACLPSLKWNPLRPPPSCEKASESGNKQGNRQRNNMIEVTVHTTTTVSPPASRISAGAAIHEMPSQLNEDLKAYKHSKKWAESIAHSIDGHGSALFDLSLTQNPSVTNPNNNFIHFTPVHPWPRIECPKDMTIDLSPGQRTMEVFIPQPATNVDYLSYVEAEPSWAKKLRAELGPSRMVISFRARNPVTEYTAICSFVLEVRDREAPSVKDCPHDVHVRLSSLEPYVNAPWVEPTFTDNIAVTHVIKSKEPNSLFALGEHAVTYTASDAAGNSARCQFNVNVSPALVPAELNRSESCVRLESPPNGDLNCLSWTWGQMCRPSCSAGHVFFRPLPSAVYLCGRDRRWKPGTSVPDCAPTSILPEGGCPTGWEERRSGGKQCVGCAPGLHRPSNSTVCIPCPMGTYQDNFSAGSCKSCPKKLTTCSMGARQCTDCKPPEECSTSAQRNTEVVVASSISTTSTSSRLATPARRKQLQRMRTRQQLRHRTNTTSTTTANPRRL